MFARGRSSSSCLCASVFTVRCHAMLELKEHHEKTEHEKHNDGSRCIANIIDTGDSQTRNIVFKKRSDGGRENKIRINETRNKGCQHQNDEDRTQNGTQFVVKHVFSPKLLLCNRLLRYNILELSQYNDE